MPLRGKSIRHPSASWLVVVGFLWSCTTSSPESSAGVPTEVVSPRDSLQRRIDSLSAEIRRSVAQAENPDARLALYAVEAFQTYAYDYPEDTLNAEYLFKAGQLYAGVLGNADAALRHYERVVRGYPTSSYRPLALFVGGNLHHDQGDTASALADLRTFVAEYPGHALAGDAEALMALIKAHQVPIEEWLRRAEAPDQPSNR